MRIFERKALKVAEIIKEYGSTIVWELDAAGSNPVTPTISSVHNGFELWTLDFFVISSFFVMYGAGFKPALLFYADLVIYSTATPFRVSAL